MSTDLPRPPSMSGIRGPETRSRRSKRSLSRILETSSVNGVGVVAPTSVVGASTSSIANRPTKKRKKVAKGKKIIKPGKKKRVSHHSTFKVKFATAFKNARVTQPRVRALVNYYSRLVVTCTQALCGYLVDIRGDLEIAAELGDDAHSRVQSIQLVTKALRIVTQVASEHEHSPSPKLVAFQNGFRQYIDAVTAENGQADKLGLAGALAQKPLRLEGDLKACVANIRPQVANEILTNWTNHLWMEFDKRLVKYLRAIGLPIGPRQNHGKTWLERFCQILLSSHHPQGSTQIKPNDSVIAQLTILANEMAECIHVNDKTDLRYLENVSVSALRHLASTCHADQLVVTSSLDNDTLGMLAAFADPGNRDNVTPEQVLALLLAVFCQERYHLGCNEYGYGRARYTDDNGDLHTRSHFSGASKDVHVLAIAVKYHFRMLHALEAYASDEFVNLRSEPLAENCDRALRPPRREGQRAVPRYKNGQRPPQFALFTLIPISTRKLRHIPITTTVLKALVPTDVAKWERKDIWAKYLRARICKHTVDDVDAVGDGSKRKFLFFITTDSVSVSVHMQTALSEESPISVSDGKLSGVRAGPAAVAPADRQNVTLDPLPVKGTFSAPPRQVELDVPGRNNVLVIGIDPGVRSVVTLAASEVYDFDQGGARNKRLRNVAQLTTAEYYRATGTGRHNKYERTRRRLNAGYRDALAALDNVSFKTASRNKVKDAILANCNLNTNTTLWNELGTARRANNRFRQYSGSLRTLDRFVHNAVRPMKEKFAAQKGIDPSQVRIIFAYGNANWGQARKGTRAAPNLKTRRALSRYAPVFLVDEYRTSRQCYRCAPHVTVEHPRRDANQARHPTAKKKNPFTGLLYSVLVCGEAHGNWSTDRDIGAALNIAHVFSYQLEFPAEVDRPVPFRRGQ